MYGFVVAGIIICLSMIFFLLKSSSDNKNKKEKKILDIKDKKEKREIKNEIANEEEKSEIPKKEISKYLIKTIKEGKTMIKCYYYNKGHIILFCDEKRLSICFIKNFNGTTQKIYSKNINKDTIVDICFSPEKRAIFCASKNSKEIIQYNLEKIDGKIKLNQSDKIIVCNRPYEIKSLVTNLDGTLVSTIGTNDDTSIHIYNTISSELKYEQSTGAIENFQILMGPKDSDLLISTFMNDIAVINFEKADKFNVDTKKYEKVYSFKRNRSISGVKAKLLYYCLSNNEKFFAVSGDDNTIKIYRNYGDICESKIFTQISLKFSASVLALYVDDFDNGRLSGLVGVSKGSDLYVYDIEGKLILELPEAHDAEIISLYITKDDLKRKESGEKDEMKIEDSNKNHDFCLISSGKDGRIKFWKIMN